MKDNRHNMYAILLSMKLCTQTGGPRHARGRHGGEWAAHYCFILEFQDGVTWAAVKLCKLKKKNKRKRNNASQLSRKDENESWEERRQGSIFIGGENPHHGVIWCMRDILYEARETSAVETIKLPFLYLDDAHKTWHTVYIFYKQISLIK